MTKKRKSGVSLFGCVLVCPLNVCPPNCLSIHVLSASLLLCFFVQVQCTMVSSIGHTMAKSGHAETSDRRREVSGVSSLCPTTEKKRKRENNGRKGPPTMTEQLRSLPGKNTHHTMSTHPRALTLSLTALFCISRKKKGLANGQKQRHRKKRPSHCRIRFSLSLSLRSMLGSVGPIYPNCIQSHAYIPLCPFFFSFFSWRRSFHASTDKEPYTKEPPQMNYPALFCTLTSLPQKLPVLPHTFPIEPRRVL